MSFDLNEGQRRAAFTLEGPVLVSAGAGTGKTRALTERFTHAVLPQRVDGWEQAGVDEILTITFTNKAAGELGERVRGSLRGEGLTEEARGVDSAWISTIHGFCARLLRRHALEARVDPAFGVADETAARELREEAFELAAMEMHGSSESVASLFAQWGFDRVWRAVDIITLELETRGLECDDITIAAAPDIRELLSQALAVFSQAELALRAHTAKLKTAAKHVEASREVIGQIEPLLNGPYASIEEMASRLWRALLEYSGGSGSANAIRDICSTIAEERARLLSESVAALTAKPKQAIIELVSAYRSALARLREERGVLDFAGLQLHAVQLLEARPDLQERYRRAFRLVMVDEFQDTDALQMRIVSAVAGENLCTVGDERQSIYGFRGADIDVYRAHRHEMTEAGAQAVELTENYRSHPDIIGFVNRVFGSEWLFGAGLLRLDARRVESDAPLLPPDTPRIQVDLINARRAKAAERRQAEAEALAARFGELREQGVDPGDMVVLVRRYASAPPIAAALRKAGFPVLVVGGGGFLDLREVGMMRALCRVIVNPGDDRALAELLLSPLSAVSDGAVWQLRNAEGAREAGHHLFDALAAAGSLLEPADAEAAAKVHEIIVRARLRSGAMALGEVLMRAVEEAAVDLVYLAEGDAGLQALSNVLRFVRKADAFEESGATGAAAFVARLEAEARYGQRESSVAATDDVASAVRIMSMHAAKGLEFPVVALVMLDDRPSSDKGVVRTETCGDGLEMELALPSSLGGKSEHRRTRRFEEMSAAHEKREAEETKRLLYVASTRAREVLLLSGAGNLDKAPDPAHATPLALLRLSLGDTLQMQPGTDEIRTTDGRTPVSLRMHEMAEEEQADHANEPGESVAEGEELAVEGGSDSSHGDAGRQEMQALEQSPRAAEGIPPTRPDRLSYSDIAAFDACPLRYWAQSVGRLGAEDHSGTDDSMRFGSALHSVLQTALDAAPAVRDARAHAIARYYRLDESSHVRLREVAERVAQTAIAAELKAHENLRREHPFTLAVTTQSGAFDLTGTMDAYARSGDDALVVDYKSGTSKASMESLRARYEIQARCYGLAALRDGAERARVVFVRPEVDLPDGGLEQIEFEFTTADLRLIEHGLAEKHEAIAHDAYLPRATWDDTTCHGCRISGSLCPLTSRRRGAV